ncbi:MAG TPA: hypothetical protein VH186_25435 [Chloroflexia bacterium]|nr:hypothetical protein [Chloroflexia bacterium]
MSSDNSVQHDSFEDVEKERLDFFASVFLTKDALIVGENNFPLGRIKEAYSTTVRHREIVAQEALTGWDKLWQNLSSLWSIFDFIKQFTGDSRPASTTDTNPLFDDDRLYYLALEIDGKTYTVHNSQDENSIRQMANRINRAVKDFATQGAASLNEG